IKYATEKKIPTSLVENFLGEDLEKTKVNLDSFVESINPWVQEQVDERLGASSWVPGGNDGGNATSNLGSEAAKRRNEKSELTKPEGW
ncbi:MAG: DUF4355 domain-containing protein, partial [Clostridioides difficile]